MKLHLDLTIPFEQGGSWAALDELPSQTPRTFDQEHLLALQHAGMSRSPTVSLCSAPHGHPPTAAYCTNAVSTPQIKEVSLSNKLCRRFGHVITLEL